MQPRATTSNHINTIQEADVCQEHNSSQHVTTVTRVYPGTPNGWGSNPHTARVVFGFIPGSEHAYCTDGDKQ